MQANSAAMRQTNLVETNPRLVELVNKLPLEHGCNETDIPGLMLFHSNSSIVGQWSVSDPSLCFTIQGTKSVQFGDQELVLPPMSYQVSNVQIPILTRILDVSPDKPYLGAKIIIQPEEVAELVLEFGDRIAAPEENRQCPEASCGLGRTQMGTNMQDALERLLTLLGKPEDAPVLAPMARREILYRALMGELGPRIRKFATTDTQAHRISQVISILHQRFTEPLRVADLAEQANMSESALYHTFKRVTRMSPLQFQKKLRLHEARRLMLAEGLEAAAASYRVGYESPSQFSREYSRLFGAPPRADVSKLRGMGEPIPA